MHTCATVPRPYPNPRFFLSPQNTKVSLSSLTIAFTGPNIDTGLPVSVSEDDC